MLSTTVVQWRTFFTRLMGPSHLNLTTGSDHHLGKHHTLPIDYCRSINEECQNASPVSTRSIDRNPFFKWCSVDKLTILIPEELIWITNTSGLLGTTASPSICVWLWVEVTPKTKSKNFDYRHPSIRHRHIGRGTITTGQLAENSLFLCWWRDDMRFFLDACMVGVFACCVWRDVLVRTYIVF